MVARKEEKSQAQTVRDLGSELGVSAEELIGILGKMGMENPLEDSVIPVRLAVAAKAAIASIQSKKSNVISLPSASEPKPPSAIEELPKADIKQIANSLGLTQKVVKELDLMLVGRELQIAFVEGFQEVQLEKELRQAKESGKLAAQLVELQQREAAIASQESLMLDLDKERTEMAKQTTLANNLGIDLEDILSQFEVTTKPSAEKKKPCLWELVQARLAS